MSAVRIPYLRFLLAAVILSFLVTPNYAWQIETRHEGTATILHVVYDNKAIDPDSAPFAVDYRYDGRGHLQAKRFGGLTYLYPEAAHELNGKWLSRRGGTSEDLEDDVFYNGVANELYGRFVRSVDKIPSPMTEELWPIIDSLSSRKNKATFLAILNDSMEGLNSRLKERVSGATFQSVIGKLFSAIGELVIGKSHTMFELMEGIVEKEKETTRLLNALNFKNSRVVSKNFVVTLLGASPTCNGSAVHQKFRELAAQEKLRMWDGKERVEWFISFSGGAYLFQEPISQANLARIDSRLEKEMEGETAYQEVLSAIRTFFHVPAIFAISTGAVADAKLEERYSVSTNVEPLRARTALEVVLQAVRERTDNEEIRGALETLMEEWDKISKEHQEFFDSILPMIQFDMLAECQLVDAQEE